MNNRILLVDDEANLLQSFRRTFHGKYELILAEGGEAGLQQITKNGPFALVVSDMQMPEIDGLRVLRAARKHSPDTVRIMLTGNVDQQTAVNAVNDGSIFRFVNKPCPLEKFGEILDEGLRHYELVTAEKELLSKTLAGCVGLINELLSVASPKAFGRGGRLRQWMKQLCKELNLEDAWQFEVAAMLSQVGCISTTICPTAANDFAAVQKQLRIQAVTSSSIIGHIPRLEEISAMIGHQYTEVLDPNLPNSVKLGSKLLRMLIDYDVLSETHSAGQSIRLLKESVGSYDSWALDIFSEIVFGNHALRSLKVSELLVGMVVETNVLSLDGGVLLSYGHELSENMIQRLRSFVRNSFGVREPILVRVPIERTKKG
jgi:CheY-like chemotaxis protein